MPAADAGFRIFSSRRTIRGMGILAITFTVLAAAFGAGYFFLFLRAPESSLVIENPSLPPIEASIVDPPLTTEGEGQAKTPEETPAEIVEQKPVAEKPVAAPDQPTTVKEEAVASPQSEQDDAPAIRDRLVSFGHTRSQGRSIDTVVLHSSYNNQGGDRYDVDRVIGIWKSYDVAPHYVVDRKGAIYRLVEDRDIAYHAGNSKMTDGRTNVNGFSIGIELLGDLDDGYTAVQYEAINALIASLKRAHGVKYVVGHADIAPGRKTDPWNFDWKKLK